VERLVAATMETYGRLDAAFNNAGANQRPTPLTDIPPDEFDHVLRVNLQGVFLAMKYEIPAMNAGGGGVIVNMSSTAGVNGVRGIASYVAAKHGVIGLTRTAALEYAEQNVRVNALAPGPVLNERIAAATPEVQGQIARAVPLRRIGTPDEIAETAVWLCSDAASFITGATIPIDGGRLAGTA
jgi:NAD(P)-dependent dehydrogenase (short-subunit alcohol dehydrogenase family)